MLKDARVRAAIAERVADMGITAERVLAELSAIAFANAGDYFAWGPQGVALKDSAGLTVPQRAAVAEVAETKPGPRGGAGTVKIKLHDKLAALDRLARHLGLYLDKTDLSGPPVGPTPPAAVGERELARRLAFLLARGAREPDA